MCAGNFADRKARTIARSHTSCVLGVLMCAVCIGTSGAGAQSKVKPASIPEFGPNVTVFNPSMPAAQIQAEVDKVYAAQQHSEFGTDRNALLFLPGEYHVDIPVGFYTEVEGLGATPDAV